MVFIIGKMKHCEICGKGSIMRGHRIKLRATKYNPQSKTRKYPNIQRTLGLDGRRVNACAQCIKTLGKAVKIKAKASSVKNIKK